MIRCNVHYAGRVQGVGFRATAASLARRLGLRGYVRNLRDGRVEMVAEGEPQDVERLLAQIGDYFGDCIAGSDRTEVGATGEFDRFEIRH